MIFFFWLVLSIIVGVIGGKRTLGFGWALFWSLILSPVIGLIIALCYPSKESVEYKERMLREMRDLKDAIKGSGQGNVVVDEERDDSYFVMDKPYLDPSLSDKIKAGIGATCKFEAEAKKQLNIFLYVIALGLMVVIFSTMCSKDDDKTNTSTSDTKTNSVEATGSTQNTENRIGTINTVVDGFDVEKVNLWSSTGHERKIVTSLYNKTKVKILNETSDYYLVQDEKSGISGYCMKEFIEITTLE